MVSDPILAHFEAKEVKANIESFMVLERMADPRLRWLQFQTHASQPFGSKLPNLINYFANFVEDHEVVCVPHHNWLVSPEDSAVDLLHSGDCGPYVGFEAMQSNIGK